MIVPNTLGSNVSPKIIGIHNPGLQDLIPDRDVDISFMFLKEM
jgi:hypothetical protein